MKLRPLATACKAASGVALSEGALSFSGTRLSASNREAYVTVNLDEEMPAVAVLPDKFLELVEALDTAGVEEVEFTHKGHTLNITAAGYDLRLATRASGGEATAPTGVREDREQSGIARIRAGDLLTAFNRVEYAASELAFNPQLMGINYSVSERNLTLRAADGFRAAITKLDATPLGGSCSTTLHINTWKAIRPFLAAYPDDEAHFAVLPKFVMVRTGRGRAIGLTLQGQYPQINQFLKADPTEGAFTVDSQALLAAVGIASRLSLHDAVLLTVNGEHQLVVEASHEEQGSASASCPLVLSDGKPFSLHVKGGYLADFLRAVTGTVNVRHTTANAPIRLVAAGTVCSLAPMVVSGARASE